MNPKTTQTDSVILVSPAVEPRAVEPPGPRSAGGWAEDSRAAFRSQDDPNYQAALAAIRWGKQALESQPRMDMPGAVAVPQERDFGRTF